MAGGFFDISEAGAKRKIINSTRLRVLFLFILLGISASLRSFIWIGVLSSVAMGLCLWAGIRWKYVFLRMLFLIPFGLGAIILLPFTVDGTEKTWLLGLTVSEEGLSTAILLVCKLFVCHFILCLLLSTTSPAELFKTMSQLGVPFILVEIMKFTMRYLAVLFEEVERMMEAQQARGLTFKIFASWRSYKRSGELLGVLLIRSYHRSKRIHEAMVSRGYNLNQKGQ
ncbi:cobalt ECF transporter T component CbiQ [Bacillus sp. MRMR6]|uniref:cobalt ECF transporter T component CbiQ n=1 Tax=Bacillus sp. MRMR6 TaxID=1928617 RepID=UPI0009521B78|nr:cobalt ECF transporter T component CbiQ [Bacillus sp. MRMR6]OLS40895.1 cobalt ECF transporter T component CbiQ [Bacillus sp. MRMR6]